MGLFSASLPNFGPSNLALGNATTNAGTLSGVGKTSLGAFSTAAPNYANTANQTAAYLQQNPYTSAVNAGIVGNNAGNVADAFTRASNNATVSDAERGMGNSSIAAGTQAYLTGQEANNVANAQNRATDQEINSQGQRDVQATDILGNLANTEYGQGVGATRDAAGIDQGIAGQEAQQAIQTANAQNANSGVIGSLLSPILSAAIPGVGTALGGVLSGFAKKAVPGGYNPSTNIPGVVPGYTSDFSSSGYLNG